MSENPLNKDTVEKMMDMDMVDGVRVVPIVVEGGRVIENKGEETNVFSVEYEETFTEDFVKQDEILNKPFKMQRNCDQTYDGNVVRTRIIPIQTSFGDCIKDSKLAMVSITSSNVKPIKPAKPTNTTNNDDTDCKVNSQREAREAQTIPPCVIRSRTTMSNQARGQTFSPLKLPEAIQIVKKPNVKENNHRAENSTEVENSYQLNNLLQTSGRQALKQNLCAQWRKQWKTNRDEPDCNEDESRNLFKRDHSWREVDAKWKELQDKLLREKGGDKANIREQSGFSSHPPSSPLPLSPSKKISAQLTPTRRSTTIPEKKRIIISKHSSRSNNIQPHNSKRQNFSGCNSDSEPQYYSSTAASQSDGGKERGTIVTSSISGDEAKREIFIMNKNRSDIKDYLKKVPNTQRKGRRDSLNPLLSEDDSIAKITNKSYETNSLREEESDKIKIREQRLLLRPQSAPLWLSEHVMTPSKKIATQFSPIRTSTPNSETKRITIFQPNSHSRSPKLHNFKTLTTPGWNSEPEYFSTALAVPKSQSVFIPKPETKHGTISPASSENKRSSRAGSQTSGLGYKQEKQHQLKQSQRSNSVPRTRDIWPENYDNIQRIQQMYSTNGGSKPLKSCLKSESLTYPASHNLQPSRQSLANRVSSSKQKAYFINESSVNADDEDSELDPELLHIKERDGRKVRGTIVTSSGDEANREIHLKNKYRNDIKSGFRKVPKALAVRKGRKNGLNPFLSDDDDFIAKIADKSFETNSLSFGSNASTQTEQGYNKRGCEVM